VQVTDKIKPGQILYANLIFLTKKRVRVMVKEQIISREYNDDIQTLFNKDSDASVLNRYGIKEDATLIDIDIIKELGMKNKSVSID
jgi:hypothetical protein